MASTSSRHGEGGVSRIKTAATTLYSDNQSLISEIRKTLSMMKGVGVDLEKENRPELVKELEDAAIELLATYDDCTHFSSALQSVGDTYQPTDGLTDFKKLFEKEVTKMKASVPLSVPQKNPLLRQFKEAVWNVHHAGQPMPGDEEEDIVMTSTQNLLLNLTCPLSGKPVFELEEPVRSMDCRHIYDMQAVKHYMQSKTSASKCPVAGCPKVLQAGRVICDPLLPIEIDEMRSMNNKTARPSVVEDFTALDEDN